MASMDKIDLRGSMLMLVGLLGIFIAYEVIKFVALLIIGVVAQVASSGSVDVPTVVNNTINTSINLLSTQFGYFDAGLAIILGLIALVVIIQLFWGLIKSYMGTGKNSSKGNNNF